MNRFKKILKIEKIRINLPFFSYEVSIGDVLKKEELDARIARLDGIKSDLEAAIQAVDSLKDEAEVNKIEVDKLNNDIGKLEQDRITMQKILSVSEDSVVRVIAKATAKGRSRGWIEGAIIGLITGFLSSILVWYLTRGT